MFKKIILICILISALSFFIFGQGQNYYVSQNGSDINDGLSPATSFLTIQKAANIVMPGDSVFIMNGTYTNQDTLKTIVTIQRSGNLHDPIVFINYPGHSPLLRFNSWWGILVEGASHIIIEGLNIEGNNSNITLAYAESESQNLFNPLTSGSGIGITYRQVDSVFSEHIVIRKNKIHHCGKHAIYSLYGDWIHIEQNEIFNNCFYSPEAPSAIVQYRPRRSDDDPRIKMRIEKNKIFNNMNLIPLWSMGEFFGGHAIEINNSYYGGLNLCFYPGKTLISNNIIFNNGGSGVLISESYFVHTIHNTFVSNSAHSQMWVPEIQMQQNYNSQCRNNIIYANNSGIAISGVNNIDCAGDYNLYDILWSNQLTGNHDVISADPQFVQLSVLPDVADFSLLASSPAIDTAFTDSLVPDDFFGVLRPVGIANDIGAIEFVSTQNIYTVDLLDKISIDVFENKIIITSTEPIRLIRVYDSSGKTHITGALNDMTATIFISELRSAIYVVQVNTRKHQKTQIFSLIQ